MNSNTVMETSREERPLRSLGMMNHRYVGVVNWVIVLLNIFPMKFFTKITTCMKNKALSIVSSLVALGKFV